MATYSSKDLTIEFDNDGGTLQDISQHVRTWNGLDIEAIVDDDAMTFGDTWPEVIATGLKQGSDIVLGGAFNDAASPAPDQLFFNEGANIGATRTLKFTFSSGGKTASGEVVIAKYRRVAERGKLHMFEVTLKWTGAISET